jgi:hypothetical protein
LIAVGVKTAYKQTAKVITDVNKDQFLAALPFFKKKAIKPLTTGINMSSKGTIIIEKD